MKGRTPPSLDPKEIARRAALTSLDVGALRAWMAEHGMGALGDDATVLQAAHEARAVDLRMPTALRQESLAWLRREHPDCTTLATIDRMPAAFKGPRYGKVKVIC